MGPRAKTGHGPFDLTVVGDLRGVAGDASIAPTKLDPGGCRGGPLGRPQPLRLQLRSISNANDPVTMARSPDGSGSGETAHRDPGVRPHLVAEPATRMDVSGRCRSFDLTVVGDLRGVAGDASIAPTELNVSAG